MQRAMNPRNHRFTSHATTTLNFTNIYFFEENETSFSFIVVIIIEQITGGGGGSSGHLLYAVEPMKAL